MQAPCTCYQPLLTPELPCAKIKAEKLSCADVPLVFAVLSDKRDSSLNDSDTPQQTAALL